MRSRRSLSVRAQLTLSFLALIVVSWMVNSASLMYVHSLDRREMERRFGGRLPPPPETFAAPESGVPAEGPPRPFELGRTESAVGEPTAQGRGRGGRHGPPGRRGGPDLPPTLRFDILATHLAIALILSLTAGTLISRRFMRALDRLAAGARALGHGRLDHRITEDRQDEFAEVARTMNGMADRLERQIAALEEDARRRQQLLADMAHELRSPVATLRTMSEALRDGIAEEPSRRQRALDAMIASVGRLEKLVSDTIVIARLDLHQLPLDLAPVDLRALLRSCVEMHRPRAEQARVWLEPLPEGPPVLARADEVRLSQVIGNLLDNALSHAGAGARVSLSVAGDDERCTLVVADTGRGIAESHLPFLFDPFYRVDATRSPSEHHAGLGLRIARGLVEAHGGRLTLASEEGKGTVVTVVLPAGEADAPPAGDGVA